MSVLQPGGLILGRGGGTQRKFLITALRRIMKGDKFLPGRGLGENIVADINNERKKIRKAYAGWCAGLDRGVRYFGCERTGRPKGDWGRNRCWVGGVSVTKAKRRVQKMGVISSLGDAEREAQKKRAGEGKMKMNSLMHLTSSI